jgi:hypothetical protein
MCRGREPRSFQTASAGHSLGSELTLDDASSEVPSSVSRNYGRSSAYNRTRFAAQPQIQSASLLAIFPGLAPPAGDSRDLGSMRGTTNHPSRRIPRARRILERAAGRARGEIGPRFRCQVCEIVAFGIHRSADGPGAACLFYMSCVGIRKYEVWRCQGSGNIALAAPP